MFSIELQKAAGASLTPEHFSQYEVVVLNGDSDTAKFLTQTLRGVFKDYAKSMSPSQMLSTLRSQNTSEDGYRAYFVEELDHSKKSQELVTALQERGSWFSRRSCLSSTQRWRASGEWSSSGEGGTTEPHTNSLSAESPPRSTCRCPIRAESLVLALHTVLSICVRSSVPAFTGVVYVSSVRTMRPSAVEGSSRICSTPSTFCLTPAYLHSSRNVIPPELEASQSRSTRRTKFRRSFLRAIAAGFEWEGQRFPPSAFDLHISPLPAVLRPIRGEVVPCRPSTLQPLPGCL